MPENPQEFLQLTYERFSGLPLIEKKLLIYFRTIPENSDVGIEELSEPSTGITEHQEKVLEAIKDLENQGILHRGFNPQRKKPLSQEIQQKQGQNRFYIKPEDYKFITQELLKVWKERGLI